MNKRNSDSCTRFRWNAPRELVELWHQVRSGKYVQRPSICFIIEHPVKREIWAGSYRDRIIHHWEFLRFNDPIERYIISAGDKSMNCRKGYGSMRAVFQFSENIKKLTANYERNDCYIVGGDFANYFMAIDKDILWECLENLICSEYKGKDLSALVYLMHSTLHHRCQDNFYRHSPKALWKDLPDRKSLFHNIGIPIGNLTSQIWANFMGAVFSDWMVNVKGYDSFLIFVDDWRCLVRSKEEGRALIREVRNFLWDTLHITLHPDKIYLQHYSKGTKMVGAVVKPGRIYISNRTRGRFISAMRKYNLRGDTHQKRIGMLDKLRATVNSYLGLMRHYQSYNIRKRICKELILPIWGKYVYFEEGFSKLVIKKKYNALFLTRKQLRRSSSFARKMLRPKWTPPGD